ncbi:uncharacterized protein LOC142168811 [Nicotiana tabacum]|uniref:Uncharacterized protein LOC142168811 n=1 Tax=Nicotiana tabacum TaxID=4097 RepID=A0AC58SM65_TOBAC
MLEIKVKKEKKGQLADKIFAGWKFVTNLDYHYNGRIWITWRPDYYQIIPRQKTSQLITCEVLYVPLQLSFEVTYVYVFNIKEERKGLWEDLITHSRGSSKPWMVVGDFNSVLNTEDRIGGNEVTWAEVVDFYNCIVECGLMELPAQENRYTWSDKHEEHRIFSKIDWIFINEQWFDTMPECNTRFLREGIGDHCPAKVTFVKERQRSRRFFQFCNVWTQLSQFMSIVNEDWNHIVEGCKMFTVVRRLKMLKRICPTSLEYQQAEVSAYQKFRKLSYPVEVYLQQRSKATWIRLGDDNTKYFHSVIKHRKLKQATTQLKDGSSLWQTYPDIIVGMFVDDYENLLGRKATKRVQDFSSIIRNGNRLS